jgi:tyrosyl-tRNA synthetase
MQAYDAFHLRTDVQVGGTDQLFNIITAGRKLMEALGAKPNIGVILGILPGTDGVVKMSKSLGNHIPLNSSPEDMYGKVMSIPDEAMGSYFRLVTRWDPSQIEALESGLASGAENPRDVKMKLAREIVAISYGEEAAEAAEAAFVRVFQQGKKPQEIDDFKLELPADLVGVIVATGLVNSKSEARRLIRQGGVRLGDIPVEDIHHPLTIDAPTILQVGKRRFVRLIP